MKGPFFFFIFREQRDLQEGNHIWCVLYTRFTNTTGKTVNHPMPVVILKTRKGLSIEQKRRIVREFTETLVTSTGITPELVTILIEEHELEDIGKAGKLRCD
jgi:4-oxalocrotonate tautomerase